MSSREDFLSKFSNISHNFCDSLAVNYISKYDTVCVSYRQLHEESEIFAQLLRNVVKDYQHYIGVCLNDYLWLPCMILGIWKSNMCFVGISSHDKDVSKLIQSLNIGYFITDDKDPKLCSGCQVVLDFKIGGSSLYLWSVKNFIEHDLWEMCYGIKTSGSTGDAKIIQVPWTCIMPNVKELVDMFSISHLDNIFLASPYTFDPFFIELFMALTTGACLTIVSNDLKLSRQHLLKILFNNDGMKITVLQMTPSVFKLWSDDDVKKYILCNQSKLRILILGGEQFPVQILHLKSKQNMTKIYNIYGLTEISCWAYIHEIKQFEPRVPIGKPLYSIESKFVQINDRLELDIGSSCRKCLVDNENITKLDGVVYRNSGDLVEVVDGNVYFHSRSNEIVKRFGMKVDLSQIERHFTENCVCVFDPKTLKIALFYLLNQESSCEYECVTDTENLNSCLSHVERVDYFFKLYKWCLNENGKVDKRKLLEIFLKELRRKRTICDFKEVFEKVWCEVLNVRDAESGFDSFADIGGSSIQALQMVEQLKFEGVVVAGDFMGALLNGTYRDCYDCAFNSWQPAKKPRGVRPLILTKSKLKLSVSWKFDLGKCVDAPPKLSHYKGQDYVLVGSHSAQISALSLTGHALWTAHLPDRIESGACVDPPHHRLMVGCYDGGVYCLGAGDGRVLWAFQTGEVVKGTPCLSSDGRGVYAASYDGFLYCLNVENGGLISSIKLSSGGIYSSPRVSCTTQSVYIGTLEGRCMCVKEETHSVSWSVKTNSPVFSTASLLSSADTMYVVFAEVAGRVLCFHGETGDKIWQYDSKGNIYSSFLTTTNNLYFGCHDNHLHSLNISGELSWRLDLEAAIFATPCAATHVLGESVIAATTKGFVYICRDSKIEASLRLDGEIFSSPAYLAGKIFVGCRDNFLYCLDIVE